METKRIIHFYGTFKGLYEWDKGWTSEMKSRWDAFWTNEFPKMHCCLWKQYIKGSGSGECGTLCGTKTNIYMHPMAIYGYLTEEGVSCGASIAEENFKYNYNYVFYDDLEELNRICTALAEYCGGTFELDTTREFRIKIPKERYIFKTREDYLRACCEKEENPYYEEK